MTQSYVNYPLLPNFTLVKLISRTFVSSLFFSFEISRNTSSAFGSISSALSSSDHSSSSSHSNHSPGTRSSAPVGRVTKAPVGRSLGGASAARASPSKNRHTAHAQPSHEDDQVDDNYGGEEWECRKCHEKNTNPTFCEFCAATRRKGLNLTGI